MDLNAFLNPLEIEFVFGLVLAICLGFLMGAERELRHKDAGISTHILVIAGAMLFTFLSKNVDPGSTSRIAAGVVSGIGFLGAGLILKDGSNIRNLTTAASIWMAAAVGMALGFGFYIVAIIAGLVALVAPRIPQIRKEEE